MILGRRCQCVCRCGGEVQTVTTDGWCLSVSLSLIKVGIEIPCRFIAIYHFNTTLTFPLGQAHSSVYWDITLPSSGGKKIKLTGQYVTVEPGDYLRHTHLSFYISERVIYTTQGRLCNRTILKLLNFKWLFFFFLLFKIMSFSSTFYLLQQNIIRHKSKKQQTTAVRYEPLRSHFFCCSVRL